MTAQPKLRPPTYADIEALPPHLRGEIVEGVLEVTPRPAPKHALATVRVGSDLDNPYGRGRGGPGGWWILNEPELHLGPDILVPDLAGWRRERLPELPDTAWFELETRPGTPTEVREAEAAEVDVARRKRAGALDGERRRDRLDRSSHRPSFCSAL